MRVLAFVLDLAAAGAIRKSLKPTLLRKTSSSSPNPSEPAAVDDLLYVDFEESYPKGLENLLDVLEGLVAASDA